jgi:uncharacterized membrane protein
MLSRIVTALTSASATVVAMCSAAIALFTIGVLAARREIGEAQGLDKVVALANPCFAAPLAVFGALHLFGPRFVAGIVPAYMPWRAFWVYLVGGALVAASLSIATNVAVRWSGLLFGIMMFLFVAMIHLPGALNRPHDRLIWTIVFRELCFGGAGWILAGMAASEGQRQGQSTLVGVGRVFVTLAVILFGVEHFLHPTLLPGVPLAKETPLWIPGRVLIDALTGAALLATGGSVLVGRKARLVAAALGAWLLLLLAVVYAPVLVAALSEPALGAKVEGINYFADTLLFGGAVLALAKAAARSEAGA